MIENNTNESFLGEIDAAKPAKKANKLGLAMFATVAAATAALVVGTAPFVVPAFRRVCLPYVPATPAQIKNILAGLPNSSSSSKRFNTAASFSTSLRVAEVGSGDGRVAVEIAKRGGFKVVGLELNTWLVWYSRWKTYRSGIASEACRFQRADLWKVDYSAYDRVVIFGVEEMMAELEQKLLREMPSGSEVIACRFNFPSMPCTEVIGEGIDSVWVYKIP